MSLHLSNDQAAIYNIPSYWPPSRAAAITVSALFFGYGTALLIESVVAKRYHYTHFSVPICLMLGGAFVAREVYASGSPSQTSAFVAFSVLNSIAPNFINLVNYLLLIGLLRSIPKPPAKRLLRGLRVFAAVTAIAFGALSGAGSGLMGDSNGDMNKAKTAWSLIKAGVAGQFALNLLLIVFANVLLYRHREALRRRVWVFIIYWGALLIVARNAVKIVNVFYPDITLTRDSEAAYYCLDPLFSLLIVFGWAVLNMPARCCADPPARHGIRC